MLQRVIIQIRRDDDQGGVVRTITIDTANEKVAADLLTAIKKVSRSVSTTECNYIDAADLKTGDQLKTENAALRTENETLKRRIQFGSWPRSYRNEPRPGPPRR